MSGVKLLERLARKLPKLRDAHRVFVNNTKAQIEGALGALWVRLNTCEDALGPEPAPAVKQAFDALRCAVETVQRLSPRREVLELAQLIDGVLDLLEAPALAEVLRSAETTAAAEPPEIGNFSIDCSGLSDAEAAQLLVGIQLGIQLTGGPEPSLFADEIKRAIEMQREAQRPRGLLH